MKRKPEIDEAKQKTRAQELLRQGMKVPAVQRALADEALGYVGESAVKRWKDELEPEQPTTTTPAPSMAPQALRPASPPPPAATISGRPAAALTVAHDPPAVLIRFNTSMRELQVMGRIKALADMAGFSESAIMRSLLMLGLSAAERDPGAVMRASSLLRCASTDHAAVGA